MTRPLSEPGGALLIGVGLSEQALAAFAEQIYDTCSSLSVLIGMENQHAAIKADETWVYGPLGLRGALALIRRISWRHFDCVYHPQTAALPHLQHFIWPRPEWRRL